jgi:hypothetical protein
VRRIRDAFVTTPANGQSSVYLRLSVVASNVSRGSDAAAMGV